MVVLLARAEPPTQSLRLCGVDHGCLVTWIDQDVAIRPLGLNLSVGNDIRQVPVCQMVWRTSDRLDCGRWTADLRQTRLFRRLVPRGLTPVVAHKEVHHNRYRAIHERSIASV